MSTSCGKSWVKSLSGNDTKEIIKFYNNEKIKVNKERKKKVIVRIIHKLNNGSLVLYIKRFL